MSKPISDDEFMDLLRTFERTAFRLEAQDAYPDDCEQADFALFLAGTPRRPDEAAWFRPWLEQVAAQTRQGKRIGRVRVQAEPPTDYQRWEQWNGTWNIAAGEDIWYMSRATARRIGLPLGADWWLLDSRRLIVMTFAGNARTQELITDPLTVGEYGMWQDLAIRNATPAEQIAAA